MLHSVRMDAEATAMDLPDPSDPSDPRWPAWITLGFITALRGDDAPPGLLEALIAPDKFEDLTNPAMVAMAAAVKVDGRVEHPAPGVANVRLIAAEVAHGAADAKVGVPTVVLEQTDAMDNGMAGWVITRVENRLHTVRSLRPAHEREDYIKSRWGAAEEAIDDAHEAAAGLGRYWDRDFERLAMPTGRALLAMIEALMNLDDAPGGRRPRGCAQCGRHLRPHGGRRSGARGVVARADDDTVLRCELQARTPHVTRRDLTGCPPSGPARSSFRWAASYRAVT